MDIDDLYVNDEVTTGQEPQVTDLTEVYSENNDDDFTKEVLKSKGIEDPNKIKFEEEDGNITERSWDDLTREEQINILNTPISEPTTSEPTNDNELTDEEIEFINTLRSNNMTPSQYMELFNNQEPQVPVYRVDDLDDDELYILDLEAKVGELSDEDASQALDLAKQNEALFKKLVEGIRKEYKEREDFVQQLEQLNIEEQQRQAFEEYSNNIIDAIDNFNSIGNLDLDFEDNDKNELASFMLLQDENGLNYLYQALLDPQTLTRAAWFILNGEEAFNNISDYFINEIKRVSLEQYNKGLEDAKNGTTKVVINKKTQNNNKTYKSIDDL